MHNAIFSGNIYLLFRTVAREAFFLPAIKITMINHTCYVPVAVYMQNSLTPGIVEVVPIAKQMKSVREVIVIEMAASLRV